MSPNPKCIYQHKTNDVVLTHSSRAAFTSTDFPVLSLSVSISSLTRKKNKRALIFPLKLSFKNCQRLTLCCCVWQNKKWPAISELYSFMVLGSISWPKLSCSVSEDSQNGSFLKGYSQGMSLDAPKIPLEICRSITKMCTSWSADFHFTSKHLF